MIRVGNAKAVRLGVDRKIQEIISKTPSEEAKSINAANDDSFLMVANG